LGTGGRKSVIGEKEKERPTKGKGLKKVELRERVSKHGMQEQALLNGKLGRAICFGRQVWGRKQKKKRGEGKERRNYKPHPYALRRRKCLKLEAIEQPPASRRKGNGKKDCCKTGKKEVGELRRIESTWRESISGRKRRNSRKVGNRREKEKEIRKRVGGAMGGGEGKG